VQKKEGPRLGIQGPKDRAPVIRPRRDRIMGSSIQLPSQRQVGTTHTILQVGPFLPTYRTMRIVLERDPRRTSCKWSAQVRNRGGMGRHILSST
jgi:hypothetical protein